MDLEPPRDAIGMSLPGSAALRDVLLRESGCGVEL
jgi:hypothetical protein